MRQYLLLLVMITLLSTLGRTADITTLRVVDLRGISGQPELETWLGSLQGAVNRQAPADPIFLIRNRTDDELAQAMLAMYRLRKEVYTPGALLAEELPKLRGQVRYNPQQPWSRNVALTAAALADGVVIASAEDLGAPTVLDLRDRWTNRREAYAWAMQQYGERLQSGLVVLAPESGNQLADVISARRLLAIDLSPIDEQEKTDLQRIIAQLPAGGGLLGDVDAPGKYMETLWALTTLLAPRDCRFIQSADTANLSLYALLPVTRPLLQGRVVGVSSAKSTRNLVLIYDGGLPSLNGSQSLDHAVQLLPTLLNDPALSNLPVGIEVPLALHEFAPSVYQLLIARQLQSAAELIAAPNGEGWALPMAMTDARPFLQRSATRAQAMDIRVASFFDVGDATAYQTFITQAAAYRWSGAYVYPVSVDALPDKKGRASLILDGLPCQVGYSRARTPAELRNLLQSLLRFNQPSQVIYLDPYGIPPSMLADLLPEITANYSLMTPSQAAQEWMENAHVSPWLDLKGKWGIKYAKRENPLLKVSEPVSVRTAGAGEGIPVRVNVSGRNRVLIARAIYVTPDGRMRVAYLQEIGNGDWATTLPPTLVGGQLRVTVEVVEQGGVVEAGTPNTRPTFWGYGITTTRPITIDIPVIDTDEDGAEDTLEEYQGSDPRKWDSDGDGLPDGYDANPTSVDRDTAMLLPSIIPPLDRPFLSDAGASRVELDARVIPAGSSISYRLSLRDLPVTDGTVRMMMLGKATVRVNNGAPIALGDDDDRINSYELPVTRAMMREKMLVLQITAGEADCRLYALRLINNPAGPYFLPGSITLSPARPPSNTPVQVMACVYSPHGIRAIRLNYGPSTGALKTVEMALVEGTSGVIFLGEVPAMNNGDILVYNIEAEDRKGNFSASPFSAEPIGLVGKHSVALQGTRDLDTGNWNATPIWGVAGRSLSTGAGKDAYVFRTRPGRYTVWIQAQPRERGIQLTVKRGNATRIDFTIPAGGEDGWYEAGSFNADGYDKLDVNVATVGDAGWTAYGSIIFTQNATFRPPLAHASFDWYNSLLVSGISNGQQVTGTMVLRVQPVGNIDEVRVLAKQRNTITENVKEFTRNRDGRYTLSTLSLRPGDYDIIVTGVKNERDGRTTTPVPLVTISIRVTVPPR